MGGRTPGPQAPGPCVGAIDGQPVALALERVAREQDGGQFPSGVHAGPVHRAAGGVEVGQGSQHGVLAPFAPAQAGHPVVVGCGEALSGESGQRRRRAQFDEGVLAALLDGPDAVHEQNGPSDVSHPVIRRPDLAVRGDLAGDVGNQRDGRLVEGDAFERRPELVEHLVHQRGVEGVRHGERLDPQTALTQLSDHLVQRFEGPGDHALLRGVHRGQGEGR